MKILQASNRFWKNRPCIIQDLLDIEADIRSNFQILKKSCDFNSLLEWEEYFENIEYKPTPSLEVISKNLQNHTLTKGDSAIKEAYSYVASYIEDVELIHWSEKRFAEIERTEKGSDEIRRIINKDVEDVSTDFGASGFRVSNIFCAEVIGKDRELAFCMGVLLGACLVPPRIDRYIIDYLFELYQIQWDESIRKMRDFSIEDAVKRVRISDFSRIDSGLFEKYCKEFNIDLSTQSGVEELIRHISKPIEFKVEVDWNSSYKRVNDLYASRDISKEHFDAEWGKLSSKQKYYHTAGLWNPETGRFPWEGVPETAIPVNKSRNKGFDEYGGEDDISVDSDGFTIDDEVYSNLLDSVYSPDEKPMVNEVKDKATQKNKSVLKEKV